MAVCAHANGQVTPVAGGRSGVQVARVDGAAIGADALDGRVTIESFPLGAGDAVTLSLRPFKITNGSTRFVIGSRTGEDVPLDFDFEAFTFLRGVVVGDAHSHVFLAVSDEYGTVGTIDSWGRRFHVSDDGGSAVTLERGEVAIFEGVDVPAGPPGVVCATETAGWGVPGPAGEDPPAHAIRQIEVAVETDYEYFELFGDLDAAGAYIMKLYGAIGDIYIRDLNATVVLTFVRLWPNEEDDLFDTPTLGDFRAYWINNMQDVHRDVAQFESGNRFATAGGQAFLNGLCNTNGYSICWYLLGHFATPDTPHVFNRDITVTAHELGHNSGTPHTHDLNIDSCDDPNTTPQRGTIMAYCGQTFTGGTANHDLRFHTVVQDRIHDFLVTRECLALDCNLNGVDDEIDIAEGASLDVNANGIPDECEDCNGNGQFDDVDIAMGVSLDVNANGLPDECEPDCNGNGVPDDLDIAMRRSLDAYGNGVPDECEEDVNANGTSDYTEIQLDMSLDLNRNAVLDAFEDCDGDGVDDLTALAGAHNIWIAALGQDGLREYLSLTGTFVSMSAGAGIMDGHDVEITPDGRVLVTSAGDDRVVQYTLDGALIGDLVGPGAGGLDRPGGMAQTGDGRLLVASGATDSVLAYNVLNGGFLGTLVSAGAGGIDNPFALEIGPDGALYVTSDTGEVVAFDPNSGAPLGTLVSAKGNGGLIEPRGLLFVQDGPLLVTSHGTDEVLAFDAETGEFIESWAKLGLEFDQPWDIELGPDGAVYVSRSHDHESAGDDGLLHLTNARVFAFDPALGNMIRAYVLGVNSGIDHPTGFAFQAGDMVDCNRNLRQDSCDIAMGTSQDGNANGVPDECEGYCTADFNKDGSLNILDFVSLQVAFQAGDDSADINADGSLNILDFVIFQVLFKAGCP
jgi:hypothetical protein